MPKLFASIRSGRRAGWSLARAFSIPITRTDEVYVVVSEGIECVAVEAGRSPAHVMINASLAFALAGRTHSNRIARQTLIDAVANRQVEVHPEFWKPATAGAADAKLDKKGFVWVPE